MKKLFILGLVVSSTVIASEKSICGLEDNRSVSHVSQVGRAIESKLGQNACTLTMFSKSCAISAGHCSRVLKYAEFNTPLSIERVLQRSAEEDIYEIDSSQLKSVHNGIGDDWAVMRLKPNEVTKKYPGDVQGFIEVSFDDFEIGDEVKITGYGVTSEPDTFQAQQSHRGKITGVGLEDVPWVVNQEAVIQHQVDTTGGNSGSSIVHMPTGKIIGIHTNAGCGFSERFSNTGMIIAKNEELKKAIKTCLDSEKEDEK